MSGPVETELKLEIALGDIVKLESSKLCGSEQGKTHHLVSTYFDTLGFDLQSADYSLRIRKIGKKHIQTVKAENAATAGLFVRPEWECAVEQNRPVFDECCGPLSIAINPKILSKLNPIFITDIKRTVRTVIENGAKIEFAIDKGEILAGGHRLAICEVELELKAGDCEEVFAFARRLDEVIPIRLGVQSKSARGYHLLNGAQESAVKASNITLDFDGYAGDSFCVIAKACLRQYRLNEVLLMETGGAAPLHQARVAIRRLRTAISLYKPWFVQDERAASIRSALKELGAVLGEIRNLDVLIERVDSDVRAQLLAIRDVQMAKTLITLASPTVRLLMIDITEWLELGSWRNSSSDPMLLELNVGKFAHSLLDTHRKRLRHIGKRIGTCDDVHRHKIRIEAKKLRYATEFFASLYPEKKAQLRHKAFIAAIEHMQNGLGALNDFVTGPEVLAKYRFDAEAQKIGVHDRAHLLTRAERDYHALFEIKRFWH